VHQTPLKILTLKLDENDLKKYLESVIGELKNSKNK